MVAINEKASGAFQHVDARGCLEIAVAHDGEMREHRVHDLQLRLAGESESDARAQHPVASFDSFLGRSPRGARHGLGRRRDGLWHEWLSIAEKALVAPLEQRITRELPAAFFV